MVQRRPDIEEFAGLFVRDVHSKTALDRFMTKAFVLLGKVATFVFMCVVVPAYFISKNPAYGEKLEQYEYPLSVVLGVGVLSFVVIFLYLAVRVLGGQQNIDGFGRQTLYVLKKLFLMIFLPALVLLAMLGIGIVIWLKAGGSFN